MTTDKILYTDGHKVTITDSTFRVDKDLYRMEGIIRHNFRVISPRRLPVLLLVSAGLVFLLLGVFNVIPGNFIQDLEVGNYILTKRFLSLIFGAAMLIAGIVFLIVQKEKYGVQIVTAEGEKEVIVSKKKEYVAMIDEALSRALQRWKF